MSASALYIGIDIGTSGVRAVAVDEVKSLCGQASVPLPSPQHHGPQVEQDAELWWSATCQCLTQLCQQIPPTAVAAISVDATSATLVMTDGSTTPLSPAWMYNDARSQSQAVAIQQHAPVNTAAHGATGTLAKLLRYEQSANLNSATKLFHQADWIAARLRGDAQTISDTNNAMKLGYDPQQNDWPAWVREILATNTIPAGILPIVVKPGTQTGTLSASLASQFGIPADTPIIAGSTDSTASILATEASQIGDAITSLGSTLVIKIIADTPIFSARHGVYSQPLFLGNKLCWLVGGASNSGGAVLKQHFNLEQIQSLSTQLNPHQPTNLNYYPLPATGERFPLADPTTQPRLTPRPDGDVIFLQGLLEGIAAIERDAYALLGELGAGTPQRIYTTGGGARNTAWTEIRQRMLKIPVMAAPQTEAAYGSALLAWRSQQHTT